MKACTFRNRFVLSCLVIGAAVLVGQETRADFYELEREFQSATMISSTEDQKNIRLSTVPLEQCTISRRPEIEFPTFTEGSSFSEEVRVFMDNDDFKHLIFELIDKNTNTVVEYTKCRTEPMKGEEVDFGPYKRSAASLDELKMTRKTGTYLVHSCIRDQNESYSRLIFNIRPTGKRTLPQELNLSEDQGLVNSLRRELKELGAGGGNDREASVDHLQIYTRDDGTKALKAKIRGIIKQSGEIPGFEKRRVGFVELSVPVMKWGTIYQLEDHVEEFDVTIGFVDKQWKLQETVADHSKKQGVPLLGLEVESKIRFSEAFERVIASKLLDHMTAVEMINLK